MERREDHGEEVVIVGGSIAGLAAAVALKRLGVPSLVLESSTELRPTVAAVSLFPSAWRALDALGVAQKLSSIYPTYYGGSVTDVTSGAVRKISYAGTLDRGEMGVRTVHGGALLRALAEELPPSSIRFSSKLASIRTDAIQDSPIYVLHMDDGTIVKAKVLVGCDGLYSAVGQWLGLAAPVHSGFQAVRGVAVFPQDHGLKYEVEQFVGDGFTAGFVPLSDKEVHWFILYKSSTKGEDCPPKEPELIQKHVLEKLARNLPATYLDIVQRCDLATLTSVPMMHRQPWDAVFGTLCKGTATVAGDAMLPITPDLLQGGGSALVDAIILGHNIADSISRSRDFEAKRVMEALQKYAKEQRWNVARLVVASYLTRWVQQRGSGWLWKFIKDKVTSRLIYNNIADAINHYDVGN